MTDTTREGDRIGKLLRAAVDIADGTSELAERRQALLEVMAELVDADCGHWAAIRARRESGNILLLAALHFGYSEEQLAVFTQFALDGEVQADLHRRLTKELRELPRVGDFWAANGRDAIPEMVSDPNHPITQWTRRLGVGAYMQAGRFSSQHVESTLTLGRYLGRPQFDDADRDLLDFAFSNIPWLWASPDERVPQQHVEVLTPRQRAVAFLLLDGLSRKKIATRLGISEETVNHHMKGVFRHFGVQSATELAALFLRSQ